jgi:hypothetical protein
MQNNLLGFNFKVKTSYSCHSNLTIKMSTNNSLNILLFFPPYLPFFLPPSLPPFLSSSLPPFLPPSLPSFLLSSLLPFYLPIYSSVFAEMGSRCIAQSGFELIIVLPLSLPLQCWDYRYSPPCLTF